MQNRVQSQQLRRFGLLVGGIFGLIGLWPVVLRSAAPRAWALVLGGLLILPALVWPTSLGPVYRGWMTIGHALGWVNTRLLLGLVFYGLITPMGLVRRFLLGRDPMRRQFEPEADTYRVPRQPRPATHLKQQF
jgi:hypothetical protein